MPRLGRLAVSLVIDPLGQNADEIRSSPAYESHSPDSEIDPLLLIERALAIGLDGLVITEHDYQWEPDELAELAARAAPLRVFSGAEISAREGHFLVYGLPSLDEVPPGVALAELLRDRPASMTRPSWPPTRSAGTSHSTPIVAEHGPVFDALELVSNNVSRRDARARPRPCSGPIRWGRPARAMPTSSRRRGLLFHRVRRADRFDRRLRGGPAQSPGPPAAPVGGQPGLSVWSIKFTRSVARGLAMRRKLFGRPNSQPLHSPLYAGPPLFYGRL